MNATGIYDAAELARQCVCDQMDALAAEIDDYPGCSCLSYVSAGEPSIDCCLAGCDEGGMLTVHIENVYPSDNFPQAFEGFQPCKAGTWVGVLVITAARCAPTVDEQGNMASAEALSASALLMALDQYAILTALSCCLANESIPGKRRRRVQVSETRPLVSEGGCASVEVRAFVELGAICSCPPASS